LQPDSGRAGEGVVGEGGDEDAGHDRPRLAELAGEDEGEQLRLVADLGKRDDAERDEESVQIGSLVPGGGR
jgi:hypothetical protein